MPERLPHLLRADAAENRMLVLDAARTLFAERGLDVPMREVARRAGVGPATLYRRFATKQQLIDEAFADELEACQRIVFDAAADPDPWRGLCRVLREVGELNARNQGFVDAVLSSLPGGFDLAEHRASMLRSLGDLCRRAREAGALRADFQLGDLVLFLAAGRGLAGSTTHERLRAARRFSELAIDALRAPPARV